MLQHTNFVSHPSKSKNYFFFFIAKIAISLICCHNLVGEATSLHITMIYPKTSLSRHLTTTRFIYHSIRHINAYLIAIRCNQMAFNTHLPHPNNKPRQLHIDAHTCMRVLVCKTWSIINRLSCIHSVTAAVIMPWHLAGTNLCCQLTISEIGTTGNSSDKTQKKCRSPKLN